MPKIAYTPKVFDALRSELIRRAEFICREFVAQGYDITLRQLYYQFVARDWFPDSWKNAQGTNNHQGNYDKLGDLINDARLAGLIDWNHIIDRTRNLERNAHWDKPSTMIYQNSLTYLNDKWLDQPQYVEVWIEKDALKGVIDRICTRLDVPFFSCRGYTSQSEMWGASQRLIKKIDSGKLVHIIHLGDHDPSGMDMSRDIKDRLTLFLQGRHVHVLRAALNKSQIDRYNPPPNPAKVTDSRAKAYIAQYGDFSWELDALPPNVLSDIVSRAVSMYRDEKLWQASLDKEKRGRKTLKTLYDKFALVVDHLRKLQRLDFND